MLIHEEFFMCKCMATGLNPETKMFHVAQERIGGVMRRLRIKQQHEPGVSFTTDRAERNRVALIFVCSAQEASLLVGFNKMNCADGRALCHS